MNATVITPVIDFNMYARCVSHNENLHFVKKVVIDNRKKNEGIPSVYNRFLDNYDYSVPSWLLFCHEDFQILEPLENSFHGLMTDSIYGPIGSCLVHKKKPCVLGGLWASKFVGCITQCNKAGNDICTIGVPATIGEVVDTLDCMCIVVHSALVKQYGLRFDTNLSFDLYAEDFCAAASLRHGVKTRILPFKCKHWSQGQIAHRFHEQRNYLYHKYPANEFASTTGYTIGAGNTPIRRLQLRMRRVLDNYAPLLATKIVYFLGRS